MPDSNNNNNNNKSTLLTYIGTVTLCQLWVEIKGRRMTRQQGEEFLQGGHRTQWVTRLLIYESPQAFFGFFSGIFVVFCAFIERQGDIFQAIFIVVNAERVRL